MIVVFLPKLLFEFTSSLYSIESLPLFCPVWSNLPFLFFPFPLCFSLSSVSRLSSLASLVSRLSLSEPLFFPSLPVAFLSFFSLFPRIPPILPSSPSKVYLRVGRTLLSPIPFFEHIFGLFSWLSLALEGAPCWSNDEQPFLQFLILEARHWGRWLPSV